MVFHKPGTQRQNRPSRCLSGCETNAAHVSLRKIAMNSRSPLVVVMLVALVFVLSGCDTGLQHMGTTEYGVRFRKLPRFLGGGVGGADSVARPLETVVVMPWEEIYRFNTSPRYLTWGRGMGDAGGVTHLVQNEDVHTRVLDGNEAALKIKVWYHIKPQPETLVKLVQEVATNEEEIKHLVISVVRSEIRSNLNRLKTAEFRDVKKLNATIDSTLSATQSRLGPMGIEVEGLNLLEYRFVRLLPDGSEDTSYQDRLREIQEKEQDIQGERSRIETVRAKKQKEYSEAESKFNSRVAEARGFKEQSVYQGDAYYEARSNEAKAILAEGTAEVEGLQKQIAALSGKGGKAMLRLEVAKQLAKANPKFVAINPSNASTGEGARIDLSKTDMNQLLQQLGVTEALLGQPQAGRAETQAQSPVNQSASEGGERAGGVQQ